MYGAVPPTPLTEADPSFPPKQDTLLTTEQLLPSTDGSVMVTEQVSVHPLSSVKV